MTDFRQLCARMADELDHYRQLLMDDRRETHALATEARAALAEGDGAGPTDEELIKLSLATKLYRFQPTAGDPIVYELSDQQLMAYARAAIARYGTHPRPIPVAERLPTATIEQAWKQHSKVATFNDGEILSFEGFRAAVADILAAAIPLPEEPGD